ncbi:MAG: GlsB/YeaQ/YmgE family stress response membrane protein [Planctomycetota bacterium]|nr:MAG: GlsB/YeaQ/YmgE family stress response membrane protein [Planctomycetota bacterium]
MTFLEFLVYLLIAAVCGAIGGAIGGLTRGGCLVSIALGFVGAVLGTWLAGLLGLPQFLVVDVGGSDFPVVWAVIGSALFVAVLGLFRPRPRS